VSKETDRDYQQAFLLPLASRFKLSKFLKEQPENSVEKNRSWGPHYFSVRQDGLPQSPPLSWANFPV
jgi:hypothetical protein